ncbi:MAG: hypothetical protein ABIY55_15180 [Kofleriaceae bacterium]
MAAFQHLLQRLGFVKLGRFGLELTPDGRILSTRPAVLDDGAGGRIVGWEDRDLAAVELPSWQPAQNPALRAPAQRFIALPAPPPAPARARPAAIPPAIPAVSHARSVVAPASAAVIPAAVAGEPVVDEDDWEWTIALARARAEDAPAVPPPAAAKTLPMAAVTATPVAAKEPAASAEWPATQPIGPIDDDDYAAVPTRPAIAIPRIAQPRTAAVMPVASAPITLIPFANAPSTVIPVPALPTMRSTANASPLAPVVRTIPAQQASGPRRFPKGTGPQGPATTTRVMTAMSGDTTSSAAIGEHTRLGVTPASASSVGDQTQVGLALPPAARTVALPSITRRSSR